MQECNIYMAENSWGWGAYLLVQTISADDWAGDHPVNVTALQILFLKVSFYG